MINLFGEKDPMSMEDYREVKSLLLSNHITEAEAKADSLLKIENGSNDKYYWTGLISSEIFIYKKSFQEAKDLLFKLLESSNQIEFPPNYTVLIYQKIAFLFFQLKEYDESIKFYNYILDLDQQNLNQQYKCYKYLLDCYYKLNEEPEFKQILTTAVNKIINSLTSTSISSSIDFIWGCTKYSSKEPWKSIINEVVNYLDSPLSTNLKKVIIEFIWIRIAHIQTNLHEFLVHVERCKTYLCSCEETVIITININLAFMMENPFGEHQRAISLLLECLAYCPNPTMMRVQILNRLGSSYRFLGDYQEAIRFLREALKICKSLVKDDWQASYAHNTLGMVYTLQGNNQKAMMHYKSSIKLNIKNKDDYSLAFTYGAIGWLKSNQGKLLEAKKWYEKALLRFENSFKTPAIIILAYAELLSRLGNGHYTKIEELVNRAKKMVFESKKRLDISRYYNTLGNIALNSGSYEKAEENFSCALNYGDSFEVEGQTLLGLSKVNIGLFLKNDDIKNLNRAKVNLNNLKEIVKSSLLIQMEVDLILGIIDMYHHQYSRAKTKFDRVLQHSRSNEFFSLEKRVKKQIQTLEKFKIQRKLQNIITKANSPDKFETNTINEALEYLNDLTKIVNSQADGLIKNNKEK